MYVDLRTVIARADGKVTNSKVEKKKKRKRQKKKKKKKKKHWPPFEQTGFCYWGFFVDLGLYHHIPIGITYFIFPDFPSFTYKNFVWNINKLLPCTRKEVHLKQKLIRWRNALVTLHSNWAVYHGTRVCVCSHHVLYIHLVTEWYSLCANVESISLVGPKTTSLTPQAKP